MDREQALEALKLRVEKPENIKHSLAVEAVMRELARLFHEDMEQWGIAGLVHDIDIERVYKNNTAAGTMSGDILEGLDFDETIVYAVKSFYSNNCQQRRRRIDKALFCSEPVCNLIMACIKNVQRKNLKNIDRETVLNCFRNEGCAPEINRNQIASCSELDLNLESFIDLSLKALKEIGGRLE